MPEIEFQPIEEPTRKKTFVDLRNLFQNLRMKVTKDAFQSYNYVLNTSGWKLDADGIFGNVLNVNVVNLYVATNTIPFDVTDGYAGTRTNPLMRLTAASGYPLLLQVNTFTSTHFKNILVGISTGIWVSDGTDPNGSLSGNEGDICLLGPGGAVYACAGTTVWYVCGSSLAKTLGENVTASKAVYVKASDGKAYLTDAADNDEKMWSHAGFVLAAGSTNGVTAIQHAGKIGGFSGMTVGATQYLADVDSSQDFSAFSSNIYAAGTDRYIGTTGGDENRIGVSFATTKKGKLTSVTLGEIHKNGSPAGNIVMSLYRGAPGSLDFITSATVSIASMTEGADALFTFSSPVMLDIGSYSVVFVHDTLSNGNNINVVDQTVVHPTTLYLYSSAAWATSTEIIRILFNSTVSTFAAGDITDWFYTHPYPVGIAVSATELLAKKNETQFSCGHGAISTATQTSVSLPWRPKKLKIGFSYVGPQSANAFGEMVIYEGQAATGRYASSNSTETGPSGNVASNTVTLRTWTGAAFQSSTFLVYIRDAGFVVISATIVGSPAVYYSYEAEK